MAIDFTQFRTPGQLIQALLDECGWSQRVLAIVLNRDETGLNKLVSGKRPLDAELALELSGIFGVPAEKFLELQKAYELDQARDFPKVEKALAKFFKVSSLDEIEIFAHAAKKTTVAGDASPVQLAWLYRVREMAEEFIVSRYSPSTVADAVAKLKPLLASPEAARKVPRILTEAGIRFVIVESLPGAKIDGVCFWLNEKSPVIGMSLRYDRMDNFWFVLRHELEHVIRQDGKSAVMLDAELEGDRAGVGDDVQEQERVANHAAAEFCVPRRSLESFVARKSPFFNERDIIGFANTLHVHPGIVAGQLQRRTNRYDRFRNHLVKIRSIVTPGAMVDGWGDVAPVGI
jgi:HTH-type transcriptional regulator / antitoxin HigA